MGLVKANRELKARKLRREKMSVRLDRISDLLMPQHIKSEGMPWDLDPIPEDRVTHNPDSEEDTRVLLQLQILRRNDAGKDHAVTVEYDSGKEDCVTICDNLQKGAGKLSLTRKEIKMINYMVRECHVIASMAQGRHDDISL